MNEIIKYLQSSIDEKAEVKKWNAKEHLNIIKQGIAGNTDYAVRYRKTDKKSICRSGIIAYEYHKKR